MGRSPWSGDNPVVSKSSTTTVSALLGWGFLLSRIGDRSVRSGFWIWESEAFIFDRLTIGC
jgi:hypothetical protein